MTGDGSLDSAEIPETCEYGEKPHMTYFMWLPSLKNHDRLMASHLGHPVGRPPQGGMQVKIVGLHNPARVEAGLTG